MSTQLCTRVSFIGQRMRYTRILLRIGCIHFQFHDYRLIRSYTTDIHNTQGIFLFGWSMVVVLHSVGAQRLEWLLVVWRLTGYESCGVTSTRVVYLTCRMHAGGW